MPTDRTTPASQRAPITRWVWLLAVCAAFAVVPALRYNIAAHSWDAGTVHVYQGAVYSSAIDGGAVYPRWAQFLHIGLGSPVPTFRPPLAYAGMDLLYRLGLGHPVGWRLLMAAGLAFACAGAYLLAYELTRNKWAAVLGAVAFLYAPYVLRNAFERGSPEAFGTFLYPWVIWSLIRLARRPSGSWFALAALLWAACIGTHVLAPLMLAPVAVLVAIILGWRQRTAAPLLALLAGGLLVAFIWAPMVAEQRWVHVERDFPTGAADPVANPLPLDALMALPVVYDTVRDNNQTGQRLGLWHYSWIVIGPLVTGLAAYRKRKDLALAAGLAALTAILLFWMLTATSDPLWRLLQSILERLQYRSRLMGVQAVSISVIAACALALAPAVWQRRLALALTGLLIVAAVPSLFVDLQHRYAQFGDTLSLAQVRAAEIASGGTAFTSFGEFTPRWRTAPFDATVMEAYGPVLDPATRPLVEPHPGVEVVTAAVRSGAWDLKVSAVEPVTLTLPLLYYPRWQGAVDGQPAPLNAQPETGFTQLQIPAGTHQVALHYGSTPLEQGAGIVSILALLGLIVGLIFWRPRVVMPIQTATPRSGQLLDAEAPAEFLPPFWFLIAATALLGFKVVYVDSATNWLRCTSTIDRVCGADVTVDAPFVGGPSLRGYSVSGASFKPGDEVRVRLYWQGEPAGQGRLTSFVHIRNSEPNGPQNPRTGNEIWAQDEHETPGGLFTSEYLPGRLYMDEFRVSLPPDLPPALYFLEIGWVDQATGEQLDVPADAIEKPLRILWRSILLPSIKVG